MVKNKGLRESKLSQAFDILNYAFMILIMLTMFFPFWNIFAISISGTSEVMRGEVWLIPKAVSFEIYKNALSLTEVQLGFLNSIFYCTAYTVVMLALTSVYAYALTKKDLPGKKFISIFILITMYVSGGMIPNYLLIKELGGMDSHWAMFIPGTLGAWNVILMRTYFKNNIPESLIESAMIDGARELKIIWRILIPLSKPVFATLALFAIVGKWNSWFDGLIYLNTPEKFPLQLVLRNMVVEGKMTSAALSMQATSMTGGNTFIPENLKSALLMIAVIPMIVVYPFIQKYFTQGMMIGSLKE